MQSEEKVETGAGVFCFSLRRSVRLKRLTATFHAGGAIAVRAPLRMPLCTIEDFFQKNAARFARRITYFSKLPRPLPLPLATEGECAVLQRTLEGMVAKAAHLLGVLAPPVFVKPMRSRFGSCSVRGTVSFSDTLRALPPKLIEYIVAHEACHLKELNHSSAFWALVENLIPDWRERRRALKKYCFIHN